ncbi:hypothetical protein PENANT_c022G08613 [Penicillium antarcticum]|uniref:Uncharacterized protein n=1 Tax=Penicillium antarcticum TaxID=416450 RepID=A0A1V6PZF0_9EURO|nr:uncharacterized protein N7508_002853 [Penicillium antarcticum]KAJ5312023.1 hypothetical protein N7508_002853 [Penicillium antarcticum]OQD82380.1 hypothetical protein PENANT_c022G08613 [Penicillium antarcticum]
MAASTETVAPDHALLSSILPSSEENFPAGEPVTALPPSSTSITETSAESSPTQEQITIVDQSTPWTPSTTTASQTTASTISTSSSSRPTLSTPAVYSTTISLAPEQTTDQTKSDTSISEPGSYSGGTSTKAKIAIAVPVSIIGLALIITLILFLTRRRRREKERHNLPPPYDMATSQTTAVSTQELMVSPKPQTPAAAVSLSRLPILNVPPSSAGGQSRDPTPSPSSTRRMSVSRVSGPNDSRTEIGVALAVPLDHQRSATEQDFRLPSRGTMQLARMPFDNSYAPDDDAVSEVSDLDGGRRDTEFDEVSDVSSFGTVSPVRGGERRQYR